LLTWLPRDGRLFNQSVTDASQSVTGGIPILALDMYEHAYHLDFAANHAAYIAAFMRNIDWSAVQARCEDALCVKPPRPLVQPEFSGLPTVTVDEVNAMMQSGAPGQIIDVRPRHYSAKAQDMVAGAVWRDPERVQEWIGELSKDAPVVTFCVYGFHVGCEAAAALREAGLDARYMQGGHAAWKAAKGPVRLFDPDT
jgi:Fe-Mn family superoxide dismutase